MKSRRTDSVSQSRLGPLNPLMALNTRWVWNTRDFPQICDYVSETIKQRKISIIIEHCHCRWPSVTLKGHCSGANVSKMSIITNNATKTKVTHELMSKLRDCSKSFAAISSLNVKMHTLIFRKQWKTATWLSYITTTNCMRCSNQFALFLIRLLHFKGDIDVFFGLILMINTWLIVRLLIRFTESSRSQNVCWRSFKII